MSDELSAFREIRASEAAIALRAATAYSCELLMFEFDGETYAVPARCVQGVIPWKSPVAVPQAEARVRGVIQDRGRIVVVLSDPTGNAERGAALEAQRIVICSTAHGHIGLPAMATHTVATVEFSNQPLPSRVYDSNFGKFTYLDPSGDVDD